MIIEKKILKIQFFTINIEYLLRELFKTKSSFSLSIDKIF